MNPESTQPQPAPTPDWRGRLGVLAFLLVAGLLLLHLARGGLGTSLPQVGTQTEALELQLLDGTTVDLEELRGQIVLLDFWATWCPPCVTSMPIVAKVADELKDRGVVTLAVNRDDGSPERREALIRNFLSKHRLEELQVALDDGRAAGAFRVRGLPTLVVLDQEGKVAAAHLGAIDEEGLRGILEPVLPAKAL